MSKDKLAKKAEVEIVTAAAGMVPVPFLNSLLKGAIALFNEANATRAEREVDKFCKHAARLMDIDDPAYLIAELETELENEWLQDLLIDGFRQMMQCLDETAKPCVVALFVDYRELQSNPDVFFRRVGNMFIECDEDTLKTMKKITTLYVDFLQTDPSVGSRYLAQDGPSKTNSREIWFVGLGTPSTAAFSKRIQEPKNLSKVCQLLMNHGFGRLPTKKLPHTGADVIEFPDYTEKEVSALSKYLAPVELH